MPAGQVRRWTIGSGVVYDHEREWREWRIDGGMPDEPVSVLSESDVQAVLQEAYELSRVTPHAQSAVAGVAVRLGVDLREREGN